jgi:hypothetical protein
MISPPTPRRLPVALVLLFLLGMAPAGLPRLAPARDAAAAGPGSLRGMLARVPATLPALESPETAIVAYADVAGQLAAVGLVPPDSLEHESSAEFVPRWAAATKALETPGRAREELLLGEEWWGTFGFDPSQVDQVLNIWAPVPGSLEDFELRFYRGRFDEAAVRAALERAGYRPSDAGESTVWSVREDYQFPEPGSPVWYVFAAMNHAAFLPDGTIAFAPARAIIDGVLAVAAGRATAMADRGDVAALLAQAPADLVWAYLVDGAKLAPAPEFVLGAATPPPPPGRLPPVSLALLGVTAGGPLTPPVGLTPEPLPPGMPAARLLLALHMRSPADAAAAVPVIEERLATLASWESGRPYAEYFPERVVRAVTDEPVVLIELSLAVGESTRTLVQMWIDQDLAFVR